MPRLVLPRALLNRDDALATAAEWTEETARTLGASGDLLDRIVLAVGEALSNAVRHGAGTVAVEMEREGPAWRVRVADDGPGPDVASPPSVELPDDPLATSGRGLFLMRLLADRFEVVGSCVSLTFHAPDR